MLVARQDQGSVFTPTFRSEFIHFGATSLIG